MTRWERVWAALTREERPDRVPVSPMILNGAAAALNGLTQADAYGDPFRMLDVMAKTFDDFGGWDVILSANMTL